MPIPVAKTSFASGEIAPSLFGHVDLAKVATAATTMRNMYVDYRGGSKSRAGTAFVNYSKQRPDLGDAPPRIINWQFNNQQGYALEFGDQYVRFYLNGEVVREDSFIVASVAQTDPALVQTTVNHDYVPGDWVLFNQVGGMTILNSNTYIVDTVPAANQFTLNDVDGNPVDATGYPAYTTGGFVSRIYTLTSSPYAAVDLDYLKWTQSADVMSLTLVNPNGTEYPPYDLKRMGPLDWSLTATNFGSSVTAPASCTVTATTQPNPGFSPPTLPAAYAYVVTKVDLTTGEESVASPIGNVTDGVDMAATAGSNVIDWAAVVGPGYYNVYRAPTSYNTDPSSSTVALPVPVGANFYLVGFSYGTEFVNSNITQDFNQSPPQHQNPFARGQVLSITMGSGGGSYTHATVSITSGTGSGFVGECVIQGMAVVAVLVIDPGHDYLSGDTVVFSGDGSGAAGTLVVGPQTGTYPGLVSYFQQRRVYAQTSNAPDTYWMSQPGAFTNFDSSIPITDSDAISGTPWAEKVDGIQWMLTMPLGLLTFTGDGVWQIGAPGSFASSPQAITPTNQVAAPQSSIGCSATVPPLKINWDVIYAELANNNVLDLTYQIFFNIFAGTDISWPSTHLLVPHQIRQWCYARSPDRVVWTVLDNGTLLSLTYVKEQEIAGWARHDTFGQFISCCTVIEPPVDALYVVVERLNVTGGTRYFIERMNNRIWATIEDSWCVDAAVATPLTFPNARLYASSASGAVHFSATASVFSAGSIGQIIRMGGGIATITGYTGPADVTGVWTLPCVRNYPNAPYVLPLPQNSGLWSISPQVTQLAGLQHLMGQNVVGLADGIPIGPLVPDSLGQVTLPFAASYVVLGLGFAAQLQSVYLNEGQPTIQGRRKAIYAATVRVAASAIPQVGANQTDASTVPPAAFVDWAAGMAPPQVQFIDPPPPAAYQTAAGQTVQPLFTGDARANVMATFRKPGQVAAQQTLPLPLNVLAFIPEVIAGDVPESDLPPRQQQQQRAA